MYKKQPCDDANEDMKINGRRTKTLLYLSRIFCFTGVALLWRRIYFFLRFVWLANCTAGTLWSIYDSSRTSLPRKDDSVFELTERKCFICSFLRFRLSGWPSGRVTIAGASCQLSRGEYHLWDKTGTKQDYRWDTVHREDTSLSPSGRKIDNISLIMMILWKQKTPCIKVDLFHHNVHF